MLTRIQPKIHFSALRKAARTQIRTFADNPNEIAKRIVSTKSIEKITKSMKMVSAAKLRGDTNRLMDGRTFGATFQKVFHPELKEEEKPIPEYKKPLYVIVSSDRGLCGGVNSYVAKAVKAAINNDLERGVVPKVFVVGEKGSPLMAREYGQYLIGAVTECW